MNVVKRADWARALSDDQAFRLEQDRLAHVWTLLAITNELKNDGDWIRATLAGRSVFVQRFGDTLKGFENRCAHRSYPIRTADKGNGPVVCGFHHWRYNEDGRAVDIPICREVFGVEANELTPKLNRLEIATCGSLVFGRFPKDGVTESLEDFLGEGFPILNAVCAIPGKAHPIEDMIAANWKLLFQITLDDYHIVAVHNSPHYHRNAQIRYYRFGAHDFHSAHFVGKKSDTLGTMAALCRDNRYRPSSYRIFNIFPNLAVSLFRAVPYWYCQVQHFVPLARDRTIQKGWFFRTKFLENEERTLDRLMRPFSEPIRARIVRYYIERTGDEDHRACERWQAIAHQINRWPILGTQETRVGWFEEAYAHALGQSFPRVKTDLSEAV
jgi:phenylpropionate dioxygenase-like ring-hydroxylating dioxygenase large terminal subunit